MNNTLSELSESIERRVKPENASSLPTSDQVFFLLHRATEQGIDLAEIPLRRDMAALTISLMKDKKQTYREAFRNTRVAIAMKR